jgi:hypothetical protein
LDRLIGMGIRDDEGGVGKSEYTAYQENVVRRAEDQRPRFPTCSRDRDGSFHDAFFPGFAGACFCSDVK